MGGLTSAVNWWEESQLRVLVLSSMALQLFLIFFPIFRRLAVPGWFRFIMWLAYHGGDAVAIYALAMLFNRHKGEGDGSGGSSNMLVLEVVWVPVLLIHLGGCDGVTAYNIEDNELWSRHLLTAVSQVIVAVYVFCKSWPSDGDKRLLQTAILLFVVGVGKCFMKALAFKRASIYSLVSLGAAAEQTNDGIMCNKLDEYVKLARDIVVAADVHQVTEEENRGPVTTVTFQAWARLLVEVIKKQFLASAFLVRGLSSSRDEGISHHSRSQLIREEREEASLFEERGEASKLFVDLSSPYPHRKKIFEKFWGLKEDRAYDSVRGQLASAFLLLYTKLKAAVPDEGSNVNNTYMEYLLGKVGALIVRCMVFSRMVLPWASILLFHKSHRKAYDGIDVKVTYALLCCAAVLEAYSFLAVVWGAVDMMDDGPTPSHNNNKSLLVDDVVWPETVAQYSLAGYFVRNKNHNIKMGIASFLGCKDFLDQLWCMEPCFSSARITSLVLEYLKDGWKKKIQGPATYRSFNNHSSHWGLNMNRPFDECVLLWHLATEFCFFFPSQGPCTSSFPDHKCACAEPPERKTVRAAFTDLITCAFTQGKCTPQCSKSVKCKAVQCRQMSNYMVYILFVNPEMLLPGSRRNLFKTAYDELKGILKDWEWNPVRWSRWMPCGVKLIKEEDIVMERLAKVMQERSEKRKSNSERSSQGESSIEEGSNKEENFIDQAWDLAQKLLEIKDQMERWKENQDVWVQMLCFSASRCRGYLHAKALGKGGEFLSYVWLLLFYMGMETFSERMQRELLPKELSTTNFGGLQQPGTRPASVVHTQAGAGATPTSKICMADNNMG